MSDATAEVSQRRRISPVWLVPIVAIVLGAWMLIFAIRNRGPEIKIVFSTAEGVEAEKTKIKVRDVNVGIVEDVVLGEDLESVVVHARLDKAATPLLREDTQFWVVRPRVGITGVSGIGTILSGGYIQLAPGKSDRKKRNFTGLEEPPVTPVGTPGLQFRLITDRAGSVSTGDPILYEGFTVGRIETATFDVRSRKMNYGAFIAAPYDALVTGNTRFWNASGISFSASADGIELDTGSLQTILAGGVTFGLPEGVAAGGPVEAGTQFELYPHYKSVNEHPYSFSLEYAASFDRSVRGLKPGAPVEYRGIPVGRVDGILLDEMLDDMPGKTAQSISVLLRLEPARLKLPDSAVGAQQMREAVKRSVANGLRASLASGNLLTGSLYVALDVYPDEPPAEVGSYAGFPTIPTVAGGLEGIQHKTSKLLDKLNSLPLEELTASAAQAVENLNKVIDDPRVQRLPGSVDATLEDLRAVLASVAPNSPLQQRVLRTLGELDRTVASLRGLLGTLEDKPNSLIFPADAPPDPQPRAGTP